MKMFVMGFGAVVLRAAKLDNNMVAVGFNEIDEAVEIKSTVQLDEQPQMSIIFKDVAALHLHIEYLQNLASSWDEIK